MMFSATECSLDELQSETIETQDKEAAFKALVERNHQKAYWIAYDILGSQAEAEDLVQDAFIRTYERWDDFRGDAALDTWFYRILVNMCSNQRKKRGVWQKLKSWLQHDQESQLLQDRFRHLDPETLIGHQQLSASIDKILPKLSEKQRTAFILRYLHDFSIKEIAETMESTEGTVKSHLFRALKTMRKELSLSQKNKRFSDE